MQTWDREAIADGARDLVNRISQLSTPVKIASGSAVAVTLASAGLYLASKRVRRIVYFWRKSFPMLVQYKLLERKTFKSKEEEKEAWEKAHERNAPKVEDLVLTLRGVYVKLGQVFSAMDFTPKVIKKRLARLQVGGVLLDSFWQDDCPHYEWPVMRKFIEKQLGGRLEDIFATIDEKPIAAASIAQVHLATLKDGTKVSEKMALNRQVVVKVQYPNMEALTSADLDSFGFFTRIAQPGSMEVHNEIARQVKLEFDFRNEAEVQEEMRASVEKKFQRHDIAIPKINKNLVSKGVVVMEFMEGEKILEFMGAADVAIRLTKLYGHQIYGEGLFHGDPHPGNFLVSKNERIVMLDFGQSKRLKHSMKLTVRIVLAQVTPQVCRMVIAVAENDEDAIIKGLKEMGFRTKHNKRETMLVLARIAFDTAPIPGIDNLGAWIENINVTDPMEQQPPEVTFVLRVSLLLRGLFGSLRLNVSAASIWAETARQSIE